MNDSIFSRQAEVHRTSKRAPQFLAYHAQSHSDISLLHLPGVEAEADWYSGVTEDELGEVLDKGDQ